MFLLFTFNLDTMYVLKHLICRFQKTCVCTVENLWLQLRRWRCWRCWQGLLCSRPITRAGMRKSLHVDVELLVSAARKDNMAAAAIRPVKGESSRVPIVCHADPRSRDPRANDVSGVSSQIANPQPPTKDATVRDVLWHQPQRFHTLENFPHCFFAEPITLRDSLGAFPGQSPSRTWGVPFRASVLCSSACCSGP